MAERELAERQAAASHTRARTRLDSVADDGAGQPRPDLMAGDIMATIARMAADDSGHGRALPTATTKIRRMADSAAGPDQPENRTGLPDALKSGLENLSGLSLDDVKVHFNSAKPAQLQALAYTQGTDIHVGPGQEKHLPHEGWHVVQQKQGRVKATMQVSGPNQINDDQALESEADVMGAKAQQVSE